MKYILIPAIALLLVLPACSKDKDSSPHIYSHQYSSAPPVPKAEMTDEEKTIRAITGHAPIETDKEFFNIISGDVK